jgi:hypothetical protein
MQTAPGADCGSNIEPNVRQTVRRERDSNNQSAGVSDRKLEAGVGIEPA